MEQLRAWETECQDKRLDFEEQEEDFYCTGRSTMWSVMWLFRVKCGQIQISFLTFIPHDEFLILKHWTQTSGPMGVISTATTCTISIFAISRICLVMIWTFWRLIETIYYTFHETSIQIKEAIRTTTSTGDTLALRGPETNNVDLFERPKNCIEIYLRSQKHVTGL